MSPRTGAVAIVPVRVGSQRLPGKALLAESGKPLFLHTWERTVAAGCFDACVVATDDADVAAAAERAGAPVVLTSPACRTGSERCSEAARSLEGKVFVDVQGDWPEVDPDDLRTLATTLLDTGADCATLACELRLPDDDAKLRDPNVVKVVAGLGGRALYFSREPIPHVKAGAPPFPRMRHIGVYAFRRDVLLRLPSLPSSGLDEAESLEQLRFLENGIQILVLTARGAPWGIENRADYDQFLAREALRTKRSRT
jgi:3-deoxy-manno-octulosonate cytidylyltransferase (CMP-KDO synthetase)